MKKTIKWPVHGGVLLLAALLTLVGCVAAGKSASAIRISSVRGGELSLLPQTRNPVLVVKSKTGIGRARLVISQSLSEGMVFEFPGLQQLEFFSLEKNGKALICHGTADAELACTWGREWPVAILKRYQGGITVVVPAVVFAEPGEWSLEWVDYYRN